MLLIGIPLGFFGLKWWRWLGFVLGAFIGLYWALALQGVIMSRVAWTTAAQWIWLVVYVLLAVAVALLMGCCRRMVGAIVGGFLGTHLAYSFICLWGTFNSVDLAMPWWGQLIAYAILVTGGVFLGCFCPKNMIIIGTSLAGGYAFVAGLGTLVGQFPNEYYATETWVWWVWFAACILVQVAALVFQCMTRKRDRARGVEYVVEVEVTRG